MLQRGGHIQTDQKLPLAAFVLVFALLIGIPATGAIHESGHALACVAQGGTVTNWPQALYQGGTDCKPDHIVNVLTTLGGPAVQLAVWILATVALMRSASRRTTATRTQLILACLWAGWSPWNVLQPVFWLRHLTPTGQTNWDGARFIQLTHAAPAAVAAGCWAILAMLFLIAGLCARKFSWPIWTAIKETFPNLQTNPGRTQ